jgi:hypothetical protein
MDTKSISLFYIYRYSLELLGYSAFAFKLFFFFFLCSFDALKLMHSENAKLKSEFSFHTIVFVTVTRKTI